MCEVYRSPTWQQFAPCRNSVLNVPEINAALPCWSAPRKCQSLSAEFSKQEIANGALAKTPSSNVAVQLCRGLWHRRSGADKCNGTCWVRCRICADVERRAILANRARLNV